MTDTFWQELIELIQRHTRFLITTHVRPDCDALGSALGLAYTLEALGKHTSIVIGDRVPERLAFIDPEQRIQSLVTDQAETMCENVEVFMVVDTSAWAQLGRMADILRSTACPIAVIDHHASDGEIQASVMCKDEHKEATGRLIVELTHALGTPLTAAAARSLFAALATDTGWFRFPSTDGGTMRTAGELIDNGAEPHEIYRCLYEQDTLSRAKLRGVTLDHLTIDNGGRLAYSFLLDSDFVATGADRSETEDFVNMGLAIAGTDVAVLLTEQPEGAFRVSFRSRTPQMDCSLVAAQFGGGGHRAAAGATVDGPLDTARRRVLKAVRAALDAQK